MRHKWTQGNLSDTSKCVQCGLERTKLGKRGGHWEYWKVTRRNYSRPEWGLERQLLGVPAGLCTGQDVYKEWREQRDQRRAELKERADASRASEARMLETIRTAQ